MKLPQYLRVKPRIEQTVEMLVSTTNQLIDYLKEREDDKIPGEMSESMDIPKKIDVGALLNEYYEEKVRSQRVMIPKRQIHRERMQQIINQIKDAIK